MLGITNFDVTGVTDVTTLINDNSSGDLTFLGMDAIPAVELRDLGGANIASDVDTTLIFNAGVVSGSSDALDVTLDNNMNVDGTRVGDLTANGIEVLHVTTTGHASLLNELASNTLVAMTVEGDQDLSLAAANFYNTVAVNTVDASTFTGDLSIVLSNSGAVGIDVAVTGGSGDDRADFSNGFDVNDAFTGGDGIDTLVLTNATAIGLTTTNGGTLSQVEQLELSTAGTGTIDMDVFPGVTRVIYDAGITNGALATVDDAVTGITVEVDAIVGGTGNLTVDLATDGAADTVSIALDDIAAGAAVGTVTVDDAETLNISADDDSIAGNGDVTIANLVITDTTTLNLSGDADITIAAATNPAVPVLATINASTATGDLNINGLNLRASGATVILGSGDDVLTLATANGADTINLTAGGEDTVVYNAIAQSDRDMDTITGFTSGDDIVDVRALMGGVGVASSVQFVGNRASFAQAQGALDGVTISAVFDQSEGILWIDTTTDGTLDNNDFRVKLDGVTSITAADLGFITGVTFTANVAGFNTAVAANSVENNAVGTEDDTINATVAQLVGATVNGVNGVDTLNISGTAAAGEIADLRTITFTNIDTVVLAGTVEGLDMDSADLGGAQVTRITGTAGVLQSLAINTGSDISGVTITNIETLNQTGAATMTIAQHNAFGAINAPGGADTITFTTGGTAVVGDADIEGYILAGTTTNDFTVGAAAQNVTAAVGAVDTVRAGGLAITGLYAAQVTDTLVVTTGSVISGANGGGALGFGTLDLTGAVTMTEAQHDAFIAASGIVAAGGADTVTILTGGIDSIVTDADVETYVIQDDTGNNGMTVTINSSTQIITSTASNVAGDIVTFDFGAGALTFNGTITGEGTGNDILSLANNANLTGATLAAVEDLTLANNATVTLDADDWDTVLTGTVTAAGTETVRLAGSITDGNVAANAAVENYVLLNTGNDQITFTLANAGATAFSVDITASAGNDTVVLNNTSILAADTSVVTVTNFKVANDRIGSQVAAASIVTGAFVNADAGNTVTAQTDGNIIHMNSTGLNGVSIAAPALDASLLTTLNQVLTGHGVVGDIANGNYTVVGYNGDSAYIYHVTIAGGDGTAGADDIVELVGVLQHVGADSLTATKFI